MEKQNWFKIVGCLEGIILTRLAAYGEKNETAFVDQDALIKKLKECGQQDSDEWITDMIICARRILKEELKVNVKLYEGEIVQPDLIDDDEDISMLEEIIEYDEGLLNKLLPDIKKMICDEFADDYTKHNEIQYSIEYFKENMDTVIVSLDDLMKSIQELNGKEMIGFLKFLYATDDCMAAQFDNLLVENVKE